MNDVIFKAATPEQIANRPVDKLEKIYYERNYNQWRPLILECSEGLDVNHKRFITIHHYRIANYLDNVMDNFVYENKIDYTTDHLIRYFMSKAKEFIDDYALLYDKSDEAIQQAVTSDKIAGSNKREEHTHNLWTCVFIKINKGESFPLSMRLDIMNERHGKSGGLYYLSKEKDGYIHNCTRFFDYSELDSIKENTEKEPGFMYWTW